MRNNKLTNILLNDISLANIHLMLLRIRIDRCIFKEKFDINKYKYQHIREMMGDLIKYDYRIIEIDHKDPFKCTSLDILKYMYILDFETENRIPNDIIYNGKLIYITLDNLNYPIYLDIKRLETCNMNIMFFDEAPHYFRVTLENNVEQNIMMK